MFASLQPHELQHIRLPCPSVSLRSLFKLIFIELVMPSNHLILCRYFFSCPQSFPASESFPVSQFFTSGGQTIGASAWDSVLPMNIQDWFPLGLIGLIFLLSTGLSRVLTSTTVQKHQFFGAQPSLWSNSLICTWLLEKLQLYVFPVAQMVKNLPATQETRIQSLDPEDPLEKGMAIYSSILAWKIPWTEEPGGLQSVGSQSWTWLSDLTLHYTIGKMMSLLFNTLSRFVIAFLLRSKCLNFMAAVTVHHDFWAQENKICYFFYFPPSVCCEVIGPDTMILILFCFLIYIFYQSIVDLECLRCTAYIHVYTCTHKYYFSDCFTL